LAVGNEVTWRRFAELLDIPPDSPPFVGNQSRVAHRDELRELIEQRLGARGVAEWIRLFAEHGVPAGEVKSLDRVYASEQVRDQGLVVEVSHSSLGDISLPGRPLRFDGSPLRPAAPPPVLGEYSDEARVRFQPADRASQHVG
jgi:crotonobetainyl-CoA:carnitine CoA-transferase CaiB-like acyl-CoA transferase